MKRTIIITFCLALAHTSANAQTFLDDLRTDKANQGQVTVTQSRDIDALVNGEPDLPHQAEKPEPAEKKQPSTTTTTSPTTTTPATPTEENKAPSHAATPAPSSSISDDFAKEEGVVDTRKKLMRNSYKTQGYRIQVFSGGNSRLDKQKAQTAGTVMKSNFPSEPVYVHFYSPSWKCRMGNYRSIEEARRLLKRVKQLGYPQANIIKGTISVQY